MIRDSQDEASDMFDWSFEFPRGGEVSVVDKEFENGAVCSFSQKVEHLGYIIGEPLVSVWEGVKIVRMDIRDPYSGGVIGKAIRLSIKEVVHDAMQITTE